MGEAKRRGTFEFRMKAAQEIAETQERLRREVRAAALEAETPEERLYRRRMQSKLTLAAAIAAGGMVA